MEVVISPVQSDDEFDDAIKTLRFAYYNKKRAMKWLQKQEQEFAVQLKRINDLKDK